MKKIILSAIAAMMAIVGNAQCVSTVSINSSANPLILCHPTTEVLTLNMDAGTYDSIQWVRVDLPTPKRVTGGPSATTYLADRWSIGKIEARVYCGGAYASSSNTVNLNNFDISLTSGSGLLCFGQDATLSAPVVPGLTYEWKIGSPSGATVSTSPSFTTAITGSNIYCVMSQPVGYSGGCYKYSKFYLGKPKNCTPVALKTPENPYIICPGQAGYLTPTVPSGGSVDSVQWFNHGVYVEGTSGADTLYLDMWSIGLYTANVWHAGTQSGLTAPVYVNKFVISLVSGDGVLCPGETVTLKAPALHQPTSYAWYDVNLVGMPAATPNTDSVYTTSSTGNIWCVIQHDGTCYKYAKYYVAPDLHCPAPGAKEANSYKMEQTENRELSVFETILFPNPNRGSFKLGVSGLDASNPIIVEIYDMTGRKVYEMTQIASTDSEVLEVNSNDLTAGMYSVRVTHMTESVSTRMIVE